MLKNLDNLPLLTEVCNYIKRGLKNKHLDFVIYILSQFSC